MGYIVTLVMFAVTLFNNHLPGLQNKNVVADELFKTETGNLNKCGLLL